MVVGEYAPGHGVLWLVDRGEVKFIYRRYVAVFQQILQNACDLPFSFRIGNESLKHAQISPTFL